MIEIKYNHQTHHEYLCDLEFLKKKKVLKIYKYFIIISPQLADYQGPPITIFFRGGGAS